MKRIVLLLAMSTLCLLVGGSLSALGSKPVQAQDGQAQSLEEAWSNITALKGTFNTAEEYVADVESGHLEETSTSQGEVALELFSVDPSTGIRHYVGKGPRSGQYNYNETHSDFCDDGATYEVTESGSGSDPNGETDIWVYLTVDPRNGVYEVPISNAFSVNTTRTSTGCGESESFADSMSIGFFFLGDLSLPLTATGISGSKTLQDSQDDGSDKITGTWNFSPTDNSCLAGTAASTKTSSTAANETPCEPPCKLSVLGFCVLSMSQAEAVEDAWNKYQELKKAYAEAKKIVDPIERKKALEKIGAERMSAKAEYERLVKDLHKQTKENAQTLETPQKKLWKQVNEQLAPY